MISCETSGMVREPLTSVPSLVCPDQDKDTRVSKIVMSLLKQSSGERQLESMKYYVEITYLDFLWPTSTSPSTSFTAEIEATSPMLPETDMTVSSRLSHSSPHLVMFLFFQCQFAVEGGRAMTVQHGDRKRFRDR